jgi:hypothetical protein
VVSRIPATEPTPNIGRILIQSPPKQPVAHAGILPTLAERQQNDTCQRRHSVNEPFGHPHYVGAEPRYGNTDGDSDSGVGQS